MKKIMHKFASCLAIAALVMSLGAATAFAADTEKPGDVVEIEATPLNGAVRLTWEETTDDTAVEGYIEIGRASCRERV